MKILAFAAFALSNMALIDVASSAECIDGGGGFGFDTIKLRNNLLLAPGNWEDAIIWTTNKSILGGVSGISVGGEVVDANLFKGGNGNDVLIGGNGDKYACKIKYGVLLVGGEGDPDTAKFFSDSKPIDGLGPVATKDLKTGLIECATDDPEIVASVKKGAKGLKADCVYLRNNKCMKYPGAGRLEVNGVARFICPINPK